MRLIDADAIEWLQATGYVTVGEEEFGERTYVFIPINSLDELPTINAVPVVRCKDCKNWDTAWQTIEGQHYCPMVDKQTDGDFFCADGERIEK